MRSPLRWDHRIGAESGDRLGKKASAAGERNERGRRRGWARRGVLNKRSGAASTFCLTVLIVRQCQAAVACHMRKYNENKV
jgi:hypothetical protein